MTTVTINEPPSRDAQQPSGSMPRLYLIPGERTMQLGEKAALSAYILGTYLPALDNDGDGERQHAQPGGAVRPASGQLIETEPQRG